MKKIPTLILIVLSVFLVGCTTSLFTQNQLRSANTYVNNEYGFSFEYPDDWEYIDQYGMIARGFMNENGYQEYDPKVYIDILQNSDNNDLTTIFNEQYSSCLETVDPDDAYGCFNKNEIMDTSNWQTLRIDGANAFRSGEFRVPEGATGDSLYIEQDGYFIVLRGNYNTSNEAYDFPSIFAEIIASFKLPNS